jgi:hypothetical protein
VLILKKILFLIGMVILSLSILGSNVNYLNDNDLPVNLTIKNNAEIMGDIRLDEWPFLRYFLGEWLEQEETEVTYPTEYLWGIIPWNWVTEEVNAVTNVDVSALDPSKRNNSYAQWGTFVGIKSNSAINIHSHFEINNENILNGFYNDSEAGNINDYGSVNGLVAAIHDQPEEYLANISYSDLIDIFSGNFQALNIASDHNSNGGTTVTRTYDDGVTWLWYGVQMKFTDENWWKAKAGENINIGTVHLTVESIESF